MKTQTLAAITLLALSVNGAFAATSSKKSAKKKKKAKVAKTKKAKSKKSLIKPALKKTKDVAYSLNAAYERNSFKNVNLKAGSDAEKLITTGVNVSLGIEYRLNDTLTTTAKPNISIGSQNRSTYDAAGENKFKYTTAMYNQAINVDLLKGDTTVQTFLEAGIGYGWISHTLNASNLNTAYQSQLDVEGIVYELALGLNVKFQNGLTPFAKVGIKRLSLDQDVNEAKAGTGAQNELLVDNQSDYSSANAMLGVGFVF